MKQRLRLACLDDAGSATDLLRGLGLVLPNDAKAHWQRMWINNPAVQGEGPHPPLGWVLEDGTGRMQGFFANVPLAYRLGERRVTVGCGSQWGIHKECRLHVTKLAASYFNQPHSDLVLATTAIKPTGRIFEKYGSLKVPQANLNRAAFWIADAGGFLRAALLKKERSPAQAALLTPALALVSRFKRRLKGHGLAGCFDLEAEAGAIDGLWREKLKEPERLMGLRTATALRWHYPKERGALFIGFRRSGILQGFGILLPDHAPAIDLRRWRLADLLVLEDDPLVAEAILAEAFRLTQAAQAHVLEVTGLPDRLWSCVLASGAFLRNLPVWPAYYKTLAPDLDLSRAESWYLTAYDGDTTLI
ncbi:MAG: hypothetical protein OEL53_16790 [Rhodospirillales bacterium]|nr:hypothetical protein [Rhodospirillales bacterium]